MEAGRWQEHQREFRFAVVSTCFTAVHACVPCGDTHIQNTRQHQVQRIVTFSLTHAPSRLRDHNSDCRSRKAPRKEGVSVPPATVRSS